MDTSKTSAVSVGVSETLRLGIVPMTSTDRVEVNTQVILAHLKSMENFKPDLVCFPENSLYFNFNKKLNPAHAFTLEEDFWVDIAAWAKRHQCFLHFGGVAVQETARRGPTPDQVSDQDLARSVPVDSSRGGTNQALNQDQTHISSNESSEPKSEVFNGSILVEPSGVIRVVYRKIHLFDVDVAGRVVRESDSFCAGSEPAILDIKGWRVGMTICYDLRFAEMFVNYHKQNVDLILVPSAFLVPTGRSHWQVLLRARAIETQSFVAAPAQVGVHRSQLQPDLPERQTWGESLIVNPWGEILAASSSFDEPLSSIPSPLKPLLLELDRAQIQKTRSQIPMLSHRRL